MWQSGGPGENGSRDDIFSLKRVGVVDVVVVVVGDVRLPSSRRIILWSPCRDTFSSKKAEVFQKSSQAKMPGGLLTYIKDLVKLARDLARPICPKR